MFPTPTATRLSSYEAVAITDEISHPDNKSSWVQAHIIDVKEGQNETAHVPEMSSQGVQGPITKYNDVSFAIAFILQLSIASIYMTFNFFTHYPYEVQSDYVFKVSRIFLALVLPTSAVSFAIAFHAITVMAIRYPAPVIFSALRLQTFLNMIFFLVWFLSSPGVWTLLFLLGGSIMSIWYYCNVKTFVPFAAANLKLAAMGIRHNVEVFLVSFGMGVVGCSYFFGWLFVASNVAKEAKANYYGGDSYYGDESSGLLFVALLFSMYWTLTVASNITQTTVAGVIGTWCFDKLNPTAVSGSFYRSCVKSFGSICFGSLLNAIIMTLKYLASNARQRASNNNDECGAALACIAQCILSCLQDIIEYFNQWAYIFVGLYGTTYLESGKMVLELFKARGFTSIISTDLVSYFLFCIISISGLLSGLIGMLFCKATESVFGTDFLFWDEEHSLWIPFGICYAAGIVLSASVTNIVQAAVKTIIVCYADDPFKVHENHPEETKVLSTSLSLVFHGVASPIFSDVINESRTTTAAAV